MAQAASPLLALKSRRLQGQVSATFTTAEWILVQSQAKDNSKMYLTKARFTIKQWKI